ncbi:hypothetical protein [Chitinophaga sp. CF418]|nr:hypothetical protein [Chitinophaga sp. CF418]SHN38738.1 hypothetical protein SAMN05216311_11146 [Chitinophaga sp. CF418]
MDIGETKLKAISNESQSRLKRTPGTKLEQWFENQYDAELWQIIP